MKSRGRAGYKRREIGKTMRLLKQGSFSAGTVHSILEKGLPKEPLEKELEKEAEGEKNIEKKLKRKRVRKRNLKCKK